MNWQTILVIILLLLLAVIDANLAIFAWRKRHEMSWAIPFTIVVVAIAIWSVFYAFEIGATSLETKTLWAQFQYIGIALIPFGWFLLAMGYSGREAWLTRRRVGTLLIIPVLTIFLAFTNELHGLHWSNITLNNAGPFTVFSGVYGPTWWMFFIYSYALIFLGSLVLFLEFQKAYAAYRNQLIVLLLAPILPWIANFVYVFRINPIPQLDLGPFAFSVSVLIIGIGILRFQLFDLVPVSHASVIEAMLTPAVIVDAKERVVAINLAARDAFLKNGSDPIGLPVRGIFTWWQHLHPESIKALESQLELKMKTGNLTRYFDAQLSPIRNRSQVLVGELVILRDITSDKLVKEAMALAQVKSEFLAKVGHELRTPLTGILGITEMLEYGVYGQISDEQKEAIQLVIQSAQQLIRLVNDLLEQTNFERGSFLLMNTDYSILELVEQLKVSLEKLALSKGLVLSTEISADIPQRIRGDPLRVYQILANLVENAIKYTNSGRVKVCIYRQDESHIAFEVSDTGIGIPIELQEVIFDPFKQINSSRTGEDFGYGLGLSIVKQLVKMMEGEILIESMPGKGSTFTAILPMESSTENIR
jgi:signal transduction histidine kinase